MVLPAHGDAIRVVPLHLPDDQAAVPPSPPQLTYRCWPLIPGVEVFTVFWGAAWHRARRSRPGREYLDHVLAAL